MMPEYKRKIAESKRIIHSSKNKADFAISWSAGKDSTAMCHLIKSIFPEIPIIIQFDDCDWPEKANYVERVAKDQNWKYYSVTPNFSVWSEIVGGRIIYENFCSQSHKLTKNSFLSVLNKKKDELRCNGFYLGLRAEESRARKLNYFQRGSLYRLKTGEWRCCPIGNWSVNDVFAYLVENDIEINPCYFHNIIRKPHEIRLSWALPLNNTRVFADIEHIKRYYPKQYQRLREFMDEL